MGSLDNHIDISQPGLDGLLAELPGQHMEPLWLQMEAMVPPHPNPEAVSHLWSYEKALPQLLRAAKLVPAEQAERRVLMLVNPSMRSPHSTDTIYGGLQIVNPGETAIAHRHIAFAARFIIDGEGFTAVEGQKMLLQRGDVVVTPTWHWHDHGNESNAPVIWLDALNLPLFRYARVHIAELYSDARYPSTPVDETEWRMPWAPVQAILDSSSNKYSLYHYTKLDGSPLSTTVGMQAERIAAGEATDVLYHPSSYLYHCYEGEGRTEIEEPSGAKQTLYWRSRDTFVIPAASRICHINTSTTAAAYLVAANDRPFLKNLALCRTGDIL
ncbi:hypothetical protein SBRCBS47491_006729 [Sporothrix bragantina]|uniref:Cupin type-2 domain-containing protein n=1 Tax=Sporothrix bragantina TaxID=671064 RepID=A0ABP0C7A9_9PEZI